MVGFGAFRKNRHLAGVCGILLFAATPLFADYEVDALSGFFGEKADSVPSRQAFERTADSHAKKHPSVSQDSKPSRKTESTPESDSGRKEQPTAQRKQSEKPKVKPKKKSEPRDVPRGISTFSKESASDNSRPVIQVPKPVGSTVNPKDSRKTVDDFATVFLAGQDNQTRGILGRAGFRAEGRYVIAKPKSGYDFDKFGKGYQLGVEGRLPIFDAMDIRASFRYALASHSDDGETYKVYLDDAKTRYVTDWDSENDLTILTAEIGGQIPVVRGAPINPFVGAGVRMDKIDWEFDEKQRYTSYWYRYWWYWHRGYRWKTSEKHPKLSDTYFAPYADVGLELNLPGATILFDAAYVMRSESILYEDGDGSHDIALSVLLSLLVCESVSLDVSGSADLESGIYAVGGGISVRF